MNKILTKVISTDFNQIKASLVLGYVLGKYSCIPSNSKQDPKNAWTAGQDVVQNSFILYGEVNLFLTLKLDYDRTICVS